MFAICVFIILTNLKTTMYFTNLNHTNTLNGIIRSNTMKPIRRSEKVTKKPHNILECKQLRCYEQQRFTQNIIVLNIPWPRRVWVTIFKCQKQKSFGNPIRRCVSIIPREANKTSVPRKYRKSKPSRLPVPLLSSSAV